MEFFNTPWRLFGGGSVVGVGESGVSTQNQKLDELTY